MKKLIIPIAIIAILAISPWFFGSQTESGITHYITQMEANNPALNLELTEYNRGAYSANGKVHVSYSESLFPEDSDFPTEIREIMSEGITFNLKVNHGPILTQPSLGIGLSHVDFRVDTSPERLAAFLKKTGQEEIYYGTAKVSLTGNTSVEAKSPSFKYNDEQLSIDFGGALFHYDLDRDFSYAGGGTVESSSVVMPDAEVKLSPIDIMANGQLDKTFDWGTGEATIKLDSVSVNGEDSVNVEGAVVEVGLYDSGEDLVNIKYDIGVDTVKGTAMEKPLSNLKYVMTLKNIKKSALKAFSQLSANAELNQNPEAMQAAVSDITMKMMTTSPSFEFNQIAFKYGETTFFDMNGNLSLDSEKLGNPELIQVNPMAAIPALSAKLNADFSPDLISMIVQNFMAMQMEGMELTEEQAAAMKADQQTQAQSMVHQFVQMGYMQQTENGLTTEATFENGQLLVNGQPMPLFGM